MGKILKIIPENPQSEEFVNILPAKNFIPDWYRTSSSTIEGTNSELNPNKPLATTATYKRCTPFYDALTAGYIAFLTADIEVVRNHDGRQLLLSRTHRTIVTDHSPGQWDGLPVPSGYSYVVFKWTNDFGLSTPKDYSLLFTNPINRFDLPFMTITGVVDTDSYHLGVQYPFFIKNDFIGIIEKNTPIAQIIPIKRDSWSREIEEHDPLATSVKYDKFHSTIKRAYRNNFWTKKEYK